MAKAAPAVEDVKHGLRAAAVNDHLDLDVGRGVPQDVSDELAKHELGVQLLDRREAALGQGSKKDGARAASGVNVRYVKSYTHDMLLGCGEIEAGDQDRHIVARLFDEHVRLNLGGGV